MIIWPYYTCQKYELSQEKRHYHRHSEKYDKIRYSTDLFAACHIAYNANTTVL